MATITTKFSVGDKVWHAGTTTERKQHPCPDCLGKRKWTAHAPSGREYEFSCPRCGSGYQSNRELSLAYTAHVPNVSCLTIGSVQFNSHPGSWDTGERYMCCETGVGSGTVHDGGKLFATKEEAQSAAEAFARDANNDGWIAKQYDQTLELSDYQLESALLREAKSEQSKARELLWNVGDLFASLEEADDKEAILEMVAEYKRRHLEGDCKAAGKGLAQALSAFADEYLPSGIRETPEWAEVLTLAGVAA